MVTCGNGEQAGIGDMVLITYSAAEFERLQALIGGDSGTEKYLGKEMEVVSIDLNWYDSHVNTPCYLSAKHIEDGTENWINPDTITSVTARTSKLDTSALRTIPFEQITLEKELIGFTDTLRSILDFPIERPPSSAPQSTSSNASSILTGRAILSSKTSHGTTSGNKCCVCIERDLNIVIIPCGHLALCFECGISLRDSNANLCPLCRTEISSVVKTYHVVTQNFPSAVSSDSFDDCNYKPLSSGDSGHGSMTTGQCRPPVYNTASHQIQNLQQNSNSVLQRDYFEMMKLALRYTYACTSAVRLTPVTTVPMFDHNGEPKDQLIVMLVILDVTRYVRERILVAVFDHPLILEYWAFEKSLKEISHSLQVNIFGSQQSLELQQAFLTSFNRIDIASKVFWLPERITAKCVGEELFDEVTWISKVEDAGIVWWTRHFYGQMALLCMAYALYLHEQPTLNNFAAHMAQDVLKCIKAVICHLAERALTRAGG